jgi:predicted N-acetyltransferase YhbS
MTAPPIVRPARFDETPTVLRIQRLAFGEEDEATLVRKLLVDSSAQPCVSLLALRDGDPVGHVLFTRGTVVGPEESPRIALLAPLAVVPTAQRQGIGGALTRAGIAMLRAQGVELVFVLGHPDYYPRHGFVPAGPLGFEPPYPLPAGHDEAWMVQALWKGIIGQVRGRMVPAKSLRQPEMWRE